MPVPKQCEMSLDSMSVQAPKQLDMEGGVMSVLQSDEQLRTQWPHPRLLGGAGDGDSLDNSKITVVEACCCCYCGLVKLAGSLGCMSSNKCLCIESEFCCKSGTDMLGCGCCCLRLVGPMPCIKSQSQCCCIAQAAAFPCDEEVPLMVGAFGLMCYPFGCCKTVGELTGKGGDDAAASS